MKKRILDEQVSMIKTETHDALQLLVDNLNQGQKKKIVKDPEVKELLDRYDVNYD